MAEKRAFIVIGPESSGTKFLTKLFLKSGCEGDPWHEQRLDHHDPDTDLIVLRRSYPYGDEWPDLNAIVERFANLGYDVRVIIIIRSMQFTLASRQQHGRQTPERAMTNAIRALQMIGQQWAESGVDGIWITYEALVAHSQHTIHWLMHWCDLPIPTGVKIKDGNAKYV